MSNIQAGINQLIGSAAIAAGLYTQSPTGKARAAEADAKRQEKIASGYQKTLAAPDAFTGTPEQQALQRQGMQKLYRSSRDSAVSSRLKALNLKPTQNRVDNYLNSYANQQAEMKQEAADSAAAKAAQAGKQAMNRMRQLGRQQIDQRTQRRNFMDYLKNEQTSLGKFGDLPENVQKQIAKSYSSAQRKKFMDEADAKKKEVRDGVKK